jgi:hypothetical protein
VDLGIQTFCFMKTYRNRQPLQFENKSPRRTVLVGGGHIAEFPGSVAASLARIGGLLAG